MRLALAGPVAVQRSVFLPLLKRQQSNVRLRFVHDNNAPESNSVSCGRSTEISNGANECGLTS